jgi:hypothetical protein
MCSDSVDVSWFYGYRRLIRQHVTKHPKLETRQERSESTISQCRIMCRMCGTLTPRSTVTRSGQEDVSRLNGGSSSSSSSNRVTHQAGQYRLTTPLILHFCFLYFLSALSCTVPASPVNSTVRHSIHFTAILVRHSIHLHTTVAKHQPPPSTHASTVPPGSGRCTGSASGDLAPSRG